MAGNGFEQRQTGDILGSLSNMMRGISDIYDKAEERKAKNVETWSKGGFALNPKTKQIRPLAGEESPSVKSPSTPEEAMAMLSQPEYKDVTLQSGEVARVKNTLPKDELYKVLDYMEKYGYTKDVQKEKTVKTGKPYSPEYLAKHPELATEKVTVNEPERIRGSAEKFLSQPVSNKLQEFESGFTKAKSQSQIEQQLSDLRQYQDEVMDSVDKGYVKEKITDWEQRANRMRQEEALRGRGGKSAKDQELSAKISKLKSDLSYQERIIMQTFAQENNPNTWSGMKPDEISKSPQFQQMMKRRRTATEARNNLNAEIEKNISNLSGTSVSYNPQDDREMAIKNYMAETGADYNAAQAVINSPE